MVVYLCVMTQCKALMFFFCLIARELCGSWYGLMVSRLLFSDPVIRALDLHLHAQV